jgi:molecular chaperone IbpA
MIPTFDKLTPYAVGFDKVFDIFDRYATNQFQSSGFPPYDIRKEGNDKFFIDLAVAGLDKDELSITVEPGVLVVESVNTLKGNEKSSPLFDFLYNGISKRNFTRKFTLADDIVVKGATYNNGMLTISLERTIPDKKSITIPIT